MKHSAVLLLLSTWVAASACDQSLAPDVSSKRAPQAAIIDDTSITLADTADGKVYTLNLIHQTVTRSDGEVMLLDDEQYLMAHATFMGIIASDPLAADLLNAGAVDCSQLPPDDPRCVDPQLVAPGGEEASVAYSGGDPCTDIVDIALNRAQQYRGEKWTWIKSAFGAAAAEFINGAFFKVMPAGSAVAVAFATNVSNHYYNRIQMGFLGAVWNDYSCASKTVHSSTIYRYGEPGTETEILDCYDFPDRITFDDGGHWYAVTVRMCTFKTT